MINKLFFHFLGYEKLPKTHLNTFTKKIKIKTTIIFPKGRFSCVLMVCPAFFPISLRLRKPSTKKWRDHFFEDPKKHPWNTQG